MGGIFCLPNRVVEVFGCDSDLLFLGESNVMIIFGDSNGWDVSRDSEWYFSPTQKKQLGCPRKLVNGQ